MLRPNSVGFFAITIDTVTRLVTLINDNAETSPYPRGNLWNGGFKGPRPLKRGDTIISSTGWIAQLYS